MLLNAKVGGRGGGGSLIFLNPLKKVLLNAKVGGGVGGSLIFLNPIFNE